MATAAAAASVLVALCGLAGSLPQLVAARLGSGLAAGAIIPLALAFVGDVIPYQRRQPVLGRFISGNILGQLFGQAAGGVLGDYFGWRNVFFARRPARARRAGIVLRTCAQSGHACQRRAGPEPERSG
jgi:YNFM family putative membrane transporter